MKKYYVDLTYFENVADRVAAYKRLDAASFMCDEVYSKPQSSGLIPKGPVLIGAEVFWDSAEALEGSPVYPSGCRCIPL